MENNRIGMGSRLSLYAGNKRKLTHMSSQDIEEWVQNLYADENGEFGYVSSQEEVGRWIQKLSLSEKLELIKLYQNHLAVNILTLRLLEDHN